MFELVRRTAGIVLLLVAGTGCASAPVEPENPVPEGGARPGGLSVLGLEAVTPFSMEYRPNGFRPYGVYVQEVRDGSPAAAAGIRPGDVITEVDGEKTWTGESFDQVIPRFRRLISRAPTARLRIERFSSARSPDRFILWWVPIETRTVRLGGGGSTPVNDAKPDASRPWLQFVTLRPVSPLVIKSISNPISFTITR